MKQKLSLHKMILTSSKTANTSIVICLEVNAQSLKNY